MCDKKLTTYEQITGHREAKYCICNGAGTCAGCNLFICRICGGAESSKPSICPNRRLTHEESEAISAGTLDYKDGVWVKLEK